VNVGGSFQETMAGALRDGHGRESPVDFTVRAEADSWTRLLRDGRLALRGVAAAPPWIDEALCEGTLVIEPTRALRYEVCFAAADGTPFRLRGQKDLDALHPLRSMTTLAVTLESGGIPLAAGTMRFDLADLPRFLGSARPRLGLAGGGGRQGGGLAAAETDMLAAFAEASIVPGQCVPAADAETVTRTLDLLERLPSPVRSGLRASLRGLHLWSLLRRGRSFAKLPLHARRDLLDALVARRPLGEALVYVLSMPIRSAHFSRREYLDAIGFPAPTTPAREPDPRWMSQVATAADLPAAETIEVDVVVVGTGAGGAAAATTLAEGGLGVAMVEEGAYFRRHDFQGPPEERLLQTWRDAGMAVTLGNVPVSVPTGKLVGGSTAINSGTCYRTPAPVLRQWREAGLPSDFEPASFDRWLDRVEAELQVAPGEKPWLGAVADVVARGAEAMRLRHGPLRRNAPGCDGQGQCPVGCPTEAKRSTDVSYVPRALRAGAMLYTGMKLQRVLWRGRRAAGIEATGRGADGSPRTLVVRARAVVLACGTFATPLLLVDAGVRHRWLGRNLSVHPALGQFAMCDAPMDPWRAIPQSYGVEDLVDPRIRAEGFYVPPALAASVLPAHGAELTRWMDAAPRVVHFGFMCKDRGTGAVWRGPGGRAIVRYDLEPDVRDLFRAASATLAELLLRGGAREVMTAVAGPGVVRTVEEARALAGATIKATDFRAMGFHPLGTCRVGGDESTSVLDADHRVRGAENLYVMDGSAVPTSLGVNPQVTIMAMATRAAERLGRRLEA
jgi:choline dehydrogenase-like flavoprotein